MLLPFSKVIQACFARVLERADEKATAGLRLPRMTPHTNGRDAYARFDPCSHRHRRTPFRDCRSADPRRRAPAERGDNGGGRLRGNLDLSVAQRGETTELYRQALLAALAEVENALSAGARASERERLLDDMVEEARTTARLARVRYFEGEGDLQGVLDAELLLSAAEDARAIARQERLEAAIDLYKASGGNSVLRDASSISLGRSSR